MDPISSIISNYYDIWLSNPETTSSVGQNGYGYEFDENGQIAAIYDPQGNCVGYREQEIFIIEQEDATYYYQIQEDGSLIEVENPDTLQCFLSEDDFILPQPPIVAQIEPWQMAPVLIRVPEVNPVIANPVSNPNNVNQDREIVEAPESPLSNNPSLWASLSNSNADLLLTVVSIATFPPLTRVAFDIFTNSFASSNPVLRAAHSPQPAQTSTGLQISQAVEYIVELAVTAAVLSYNSNGQVSFADAFGNLVRSEIVTAVGISVMPLLANVFTSRTQPGVIQENTAPEQSPTMVLPLNRPMLRNTAANNAAVIKPILNPVHSPSVVRSSGLLSWPSTNLNLNETAYRAAYAAFMLPIFELPRIASHIPNIVAAARANASRDIPEVNSRGDNGRQNDQESDGRNFYQDENPEEEQA
ncbi:MAG: hypothetical protein ABH859_08490 [Pseudomonadota bacterium]